SPGTTSAVRGRGPWIGKDHVPPPRNRPGAAPPARYAAPPSIAENPIHGTHPDPAEARRAAARPRGRDPSPLREEGPEDRRTPLDPADRGARREALRGAPRASVLPWPRAVHDEGADPRDRARGDRRDQDLTHDDGCHLRRRCR